MIGGAGAAFDVMRAVHAGYAVVIQDVRGRFASQGESSPHFQQLCDSADSIAWAAAQPWSTGVVGGFGGSYLGWTREGEWLKYTVNATEARTYALHVRVANVGSGAAFRVAASSSACARSPA